MNRNDGTLAQLEPPSTNHYLGTTRLGFDVFSRLVIGTRVSLIVGFTAAFLAVVVGTAVGIIAGYTGGWVDDLLMRITDIAYGIPFLPFVIVLVIIIGAGLPKLIFAMILLMWRATARVIRSQVLSLKERPYVDAAHAAGASDLRIMSIHILPNVLPLTFLYTAITVSWAILAEASLSFLGFGDPESPSWGAMIFEVYTAGAIREAWWWIAPPSITLTLVVLAVFFVSRTLERVTNPDLSNYEG
jgi:peptide/nickel transport system permease protein